MRSRRREYRRHCIVRRKRTYRARIELQQPGARPCLEVRNATLGIDVNDFVNGEKSLIGGTDLYNKIPDPAFRRINEHAVDGANRFVLRVAQFEARQGAAWPRDMLCGKVAKPVGC